MKNGFGILSYDTLRFHYIATTMKLKILFEPSDEGGFTVTVPALPGCVSEGDTLSEARANIAEAISLYLASVDDDMIATETLIVEDLEV